MARARNTSSPLLTLAAFVVAIAALHLAKEILLPLALAILISFLLTPLAKRLERWRFPRVVSVITVVSVTFAVLGILGWVLSIQMVELSDQLPTWRDTLVKKASALRKAGESEPGEKSAIDEITETIEQVDRAMTSPDKEKARSSDDAKDGASAGTDEEPGEPRTPAATELEQRAGESDWSSKALWSWTHGFQVDAGVEDQGDRDERGFGPPDPVDVRIVGTPVSPLRQILDWFGPLVAPLATAGIAVVLVIFILLSREDQRNRLLQLFGSTHLHATTEALTDVTDRVSKYLRMQFLINAGYGIAVGVGLWGIGVPNALLWGALSFSLRFLPYIGPWLSAIMPLFVAVAEFPGWTQPVLVVAWFTILELIVNNVAEPLLYGKSTGVSGVGVIVAAIFWTWIWGPIGLVLAMPLTVCVVVMAKYIPGLQFLSILLGDQPAMSDHQRVYQRLLAGDVDEARKLVRAHFKESSLTEIYDSVLIPALNLAERDRHAGLLHEEQEDAVEETARELVDELADAAAVDRSGDSKTPQSTDDARRVRVLCAPLRDEADEISAQMLAQLLEAERFEVELAANESLTGELVESVATLKIDIAVISILPPLPPRSSRLLCRRLRDRYPQLPIVVGYWCGECPEDLSRRLCGDDGEIVTTLAAAVELVRVIAARPRINEKVG
jgi:predicted PurR-regulated permease PerM